MPNEFDPALMASRLPEPLRKPGGMALQMLKELWPAQSVDLGPEAEAVGLNMGMPMVAAPITPLGRDVSDWVYKKLMSIKDPKIRGEVDRLGEAYDAARRAGNKEHANDLGKRMAELHRIGTGGGAYTPSTGGVQKPMAPDLSQYIPDTPIIYEKRLGKLAKDATKKSKKKK